ncbi:Sensor protein FixL [Methylobacterium bullatum]|uniref:Sensor protein FixL n=1 Tax=Methylobacterium bullatum TaxID=570505 RepID=A0A679IX18_9HYPH|nr:Sensor protein FixL [Methylobacterium bullatum]
MNTVSIEDAKQAMSEQAIPASVDVSQLVEAAGDAIVVSDPKGAIVVWNASAERIFGFSSSEALGQSLDLITPERQRQRHWDGYAKTMRTGVTRYGTEVLRVPALHKDGRSLSIAFTVGLLHGPDGTVTGILAIIRDETRRWNDERQMRKRLSELESAAA